MLLNDDFLLTTPWAKALFHDHAEGMPIIDYHCHLDPLQIYEDRRFDNITQIWLNDHGAGDHYKWRLMRANGAPEELVTGDGDDKAKYLEYVKALEKAPGNPLFEWSHLELRRAFGIDETISQRNAESIWEKANGRIAGEDFSARGLIRRFDVRCICTTDDPASELEHHRLLAREEGLGFKVLPTLRPDALMGIQLDGYIEYLGKLGAASGIDVHDLQSLEDAIAQRVDFFHSVGGRLADQGMNDFHFMPAGRGEIQSILSRRLEGETLGDDEVRKYQTHLTLLLMGLYRRRGWTMQVHMNCFRNDSTRNHALVGVDAGFDSVGAQSDIVYQVRLLLDAAEQADALPRLILYSLNPSDWLALASLAGSFEGECLQRVHFGCAWWFNDTLSGMRRQLTTYAEQSLLGNFVGMLTDSRSFLSYPRHEYFRRVLCQLLGEWVERGQLPEDEEFLGRLVEDICYNNAHDYFGFFSDAS